MESAELLDLLGNDTRRRILSLLAQKPCYVTELSEVTGVSPKAVIEHLGRLEEAGLIECRPAEDRRKYFTISQAQRLEITIAPHEFGTKNGYLRQRSLDHQQFAHLSLDFDVTADHDDPAAILDDIEQLRELSDELSRAQRFVHGEVNRLCQQLVEDIFDDLAPRLGVDLLRTLDDGPETIDSLASRFGISPRDIRRYLDQLAEAGLVRQTKQGWVRTDVHTSNQLD